MQQKLSPSLYAIYDLELGLGNQVIQVRESPHAALPLAVIFKESLHRLKIESKIQIVLHVKWYAVGGFSGYVDEDTRQSLQGPTPAIIEVAPIAYQKLSTSLRAIYDLELSLGNAVVRIDEPAGSNCSLAINFKNPLHKTEIKAMLSLPPSMKWLENHDSHYPLEGGYKCEETSQAIMGPLR